MRSMLTATLIFVAAGVSAQAQMTPPSTAGTKPNIDTSKLGERKAAAAEDAATPDAPATPDTPPAAPAKQ